MTRRSPGTLAELKAMQPGSDRVRAVNDYVVRVEQAIKEAIRLRNADILALYAEHGWGNHVKVAEVTGMPRGTLRAIRGPSAGRE